MVSAIYQENVSFLIKLPGIGKKTARMILDLKDKLEGFGNASMMTGLFAIQEPEPEADGSAWSEAREGLKALGYTDSELDKVWLKIKDSAASGESVDVLMKRALRPIRRLEDRAGEGV